MKEIVREPIRKVDELHVTINCLVFFFIYSILSIVINTLTLNQV